MFLALRKDDLEYTAKFFAKLERLSAFTHVCAKNVNQRIGRYAAVLSGLGTPLLLALARVEVTDLMRGARASRRPCQAETLRGPRAFGGRQDRKVSGILNATFDSDRVVALFDRADADAQTPRRHNVRAWPVGRSASWGQLQTGCWAREALLTRNYPVVVPMFVVEMLHAGLPLTYVQVTSMNGSLAIAQGDWRDDCACARAAPRLRDTGAAPYDAGFSRPHAGVAP